MAAAKPNAKFLKKAPSAVHEGFAEYIKKTTGHEIPVGDVALVQRLYQLYLKTPAVVKAREAEKAARDAKKAEAKEARDARLKTRLAQIEEQRRKLLADLELDDDFELSGDPDLPEGREPRDPATKPDPKRAAAKAALASVPDPDPEDGDDFGDEAEPVTALTLEADDDFEVVGGPEIVSAGEPEPEAEAPAEDSDEWGETDTDVEDW